MPVDFSGVLLAAILWFVAVMATFASLRNRYVAKSDPQPNLHAVVVTVAWSLLYGVVGLGVIVLYNLLGSLH